MHAGYRFYNWKDIVTTLWLSDLGTDSSKGALVDQSRAAVYHIGVIHTGRNNHGRLRCRLPYSLFHQHKRRHPVTSPTGSPYTFMQLRYAALQAIRQATYGLADAPGTRTSNMMMRRKKRLKLTSGAVVEIIVLEDTD